MIRFEDLKTIQKSSYGEDFLSGILNLANNLLWLAQEKSLTNPNELGALKQEDVDQLNAFQKALRNLVTGDDGEQKDALETLKEFPAFLGRKAFPDQINSPSILKRLYEVENNTPFLPVQNFKESLHFASVGLELNLNLELTQKEETELEGKKTVTREMWEKPLPMDIPAREEAVPGTWAALFHSLTDPKLNQPNTKLDAPVYEHKCSDNTMRRMAALLHIVGRKSNELYSSKPQMTREIAKLRNNSLVAMTLRNEHTVELLRRGNMSAVMDRANETKNAFSFKTRQELENAKERVGFVLQKMKVMQGKAASSEEFTKLKQSLEAFRQTEWNTKNLAQYSADVLVAVENFTKGRKNVQRSTRAQECVNLALDALVCAVPNAAANPQVKPLIDRFNQVRSARNRVSLADFGAARTNTVERIKQAEGYDNELDTLVETMGELHNGKIDPLLFEKVSELYNSPNKDIHTIQSNVSNESSSYRKAAVLLLEEMAEDPGKLAQYSSMNRQDTRKLIQEKAETLSLQGAMAGLK